MVVHEAHSLKHLKDENYVVTLVQNNKEGTSSNACSGPFEREKIHPFSKEFNKLAACMPLDIIQT